MILQKSLTVKLVRGNFGAFIITQDVVFVSRESLYLQLDQGENFLSKSGKTKARMKK